MVVEVGVPDDRAKELQEKLRPNVGVPERHDLPNDSGAIIGSYTKEDAEKWIAEYERAVSEEPHLVE